MSLRWLLQILAVVRLEIGKTFFARRGLWVYLLAFAPAGLYMLHSLHAPHEQQRLAKIAAQHSVPTAGLRWLRPGLRLDQVVNRLGEPYEKRESRHRREGSQWAEHAMYRYTDGETDAFVHFVNGEVANVRRDGPANLEASKIIFATVFQFFYLRLLVFFGCAGIFMNLFRGEMLDKSLHFYLLSPVRRPVLLVGKYLAGLIATVLIFSASTVLQFKAMLWQYGAQEVGAYMASGGMDHLWAYLGVTALACVGYGSIFLAAGLLFRNPLIPAAGVLIWESANLFLPASLKKISLIFYLQSLCPVVASPDADLPPPIKLLIATDIRLPTTADAVFGVAILTLVVLLVAAIQARRLEINYGTD